MELKINELKEMKYDNLDNCKQSHLFFKAYGHVTQTYIKSEIKYANIKLELFFEKMYLQTNQYP